MTPAARREACEFAENEHGLPERRACRLVRQWRSVQRYRPRPKDDGPLREKLRALAAERRRWGHRRLHQVLRREGWRDNLKRVVRVYREEKLQVKSRKRKKVARGERKPLEAPVRANQRWSMDFMSDTLWDGRSIRVLNVVDDFTREALPSETDTSLPGLRVARVLDRLIAERGKPEAIVCDNGPEFTGTAMDQWAFESKVRLAFIEPGKPVQNAFVESFNGRMRDECLNENWWVSLEDARAGIEAFRQDYNRNRPHGSLGWKTPKEFAAGLPPLGAASQPEGSKMFNPPEISV